MAGMIRLTFKWRVMGVMLALCWSLVTAFLIFQYHRERTFRRELLDMELQTHNRRIIEELGQGPDVAEVFDRIGAPLPDLRMTVINADGDGVYDNNRSTPFPTANHNDRPEIRHARSVGSGYAVERFSATDDREYFYSATLAPGGMVVRSAAPYSHTLRDFLEADRSFVWIMLAGSLAVCLAGYFMTRRISTSISRLNRFAAKAGSGHRIYDETEAGEDWTFPNDELGNIAANIVKLYVAREKSHRLAMDTEREKIRLKKQLTNNINHELKTPLASITILGEALRDHPEMPEPRRHQLASFICDNAARLNELLKDIANITRMDDGAEMISCEAIDLDRLIGEVVEEERLHTTMTITTDLKPYSIMGNRLLLESVFRNLIDNAISYSGGTQISIRGDSDGHYTFSDNGAGVPDEHLSHIFERFYRVDKGRSRDRGGTGLGLAIVKNAIAIHSGSITARNDGGLTFDFTIGSKKPTEENSPKDHPAT